jgi:putative membrane protein
MDLIDLPILLLQTILFRPYVFVFFAGFLFFSTQLVGWPRTWRFWVISWVTAFVCEFSSTRTGIPFGWYQYTGSTAGQELYLADIPFMASLSFSFLLYAAYCLTLCMLLPIDPSSASTRPSVRPLRFDLAARTGMPALLLTAVLFALIDMVIDPAALRGDRWFLGKIYYYLDPGVHFGVPLENYVGWVVVGAISLAIYFPLDRRLPAPPAHANWSTTHRLLLGVGLYYAVLAFNLGVTFSIGEWHLGISGLLMYLPLTVWLVLRLTGFLRSPYESAVTERSTRAGGNQTGDFV